MINWQVDRAAAVPRTRLSLPLSATAYEHLLECPLRLQYRRDASFPRRSGPFARIGLALHKALEALPAALSAPAREDGISLLFTVFRRELDEQRAFSAKNLREAWMSWPEERIHHAEQALALLVHRIWRSEPDETWRTSATRPKTEIAITSKDGFLTGVIDRVEMTNAGVVPIDYKSAEAIDPDHLERFRRQLVLYGHLWFDQHGVWPSHGIVNFVLLNREVRVDLVAEDGDRQVNEMHVAFDAASEMAVAKAARPGEVCNQCDYRPWCEPFWEVRGRSGQHRAIEGRLESGGNSDRVLRIRHDSQLSQIVLDDARLKLRETLSPGTVLRVIDPVVDGLPPVGRYRLNERSEVWTVS